VAAPDHSGEPLSPSRPPTSLPSPTATGSRWSNPVWLGGRGPSGFGSSARRNLGVGGGLPTSHRGGGARRWCPKNGGEMWRFGLISFLGASRSPNRLRLLHAMGCSACIIWKPGRQPHARRRRPCGARMVSIAATSTACRGGMVRQCPPSGPNLGCKACFWATLT
jgi:hypothetical protein